MAKVPRTHLSFYTDDYEAVASIMEKEGLQNYHQFVFWADLKHCGGKCFKNLKEFERQLAEGYAREEKLPIPFQ